MGASTTRCSPSPSRRMAYAARTFLPGGAATGATSPGARSARILRSSTVPRRKPSAPQLHATRSPGLKRYGRQSAMSIPSGVPVSSSGAARMSWSESCGAVTRAPLSRATLYGKSQLVMTVPLTQFIVPLASLPTLHCTRSPGAKRSLPAGGSRGSSTSYPSDSIFSLARMSARCASCQIDSPQPPGQPGRSQLACSATADRSSRNASNSASTISHSFSLSRLVLRIR
mmetsp:Transcript_21892/g.66465  ORF Transcript_21892/g.66465 Transcript_21892/m.66465 type:complete len:228 (+) Transcript_21892:1025-1708(+)